MDWRIYRLGVNFARIGPNRVGVKFTDDERQALMTWLKRQGFEVSRRSAQLIAVLETKVSPKITALHSYSAEGVKARQYAEREAVRKAAEAERRHQLQQQAAGSPAVLWAESVFGKHFANDFNKLALADYLEGRVEKFEGMTSPAWIDGAEALDAVTPDGCLDFKKVREAYVTTKGDSK